ncbi:YtxH domain-containing protein [Armatimonas sp.]|uniref:YtxH domain-containing protein n=1 Tax=Armatimonas sp. TaxID=1872638 RepID=UPI002869FF45|nr:YtxH domain-containing protein [Armatimonas sp.]
MEEENDGHVFTNIATGVVIGLAVGGILGLLFAPKPGAELREDLKDKTEEAMDRLQEATSDLVTRSKELAAQTKENLAHSVEAGKAAYSEKREELMAQLDA